jgi:hypothetical protein
MEKEMKADGWYLDTKIDKWRHPKHGSVYANNARWAKYAYEDHPPAEKKTFLHDVGGRATGLKQAIIGNGYPNSSTR